MVFVTTLGDSRLRKLHQKLEPNRAGSIRCKFLV